MPKSLQDQFAGLGLVDSKKAKKLDREKRQEKRKSRKGQGNGEAQPSPEAEQARAERERKAAEERERVAAARAEREAAERAERVRQIITSNRLKRERADSDVAYNFVDERTVGTLYVPPAVRERLARGALVIVRLGDGHEIVPAETADRLEALDASVIIRRSERPGAAEEADYADFPIPEDLDW